MTRAKTRSPDALRRATVVTSLYSGRASLILWLGVAAAVLAGCITSPSPGPAAVPRADGPRIIGYLASWGVRTKGTRIADLPAERLTHVIYAFATISDGRAILADPCLDAGDCAAGDSALAAEPGGNFAQLRRLKDRHPHLQTLFAIGGWTRSGKFSDVALTADSRRAFAESVVDLAIRRWPGLFDGVDIDWEFPVAGGLPENAARPEDRRNFTLLLEELRRQLIAQGERDRRQYLLTAATTAGPRGMANIELERIVAPLDWINVMTYDYHAGSRVAHFNAPLYPAAGDPTPDLNVDATVRRYLDRGVPREKIVIGVPFYGRSYGGVAAGTTGGRFQEATARPPADWGAAGLDYKSLVRKNPEAHGFRRFWDTEAGVPWLYDEATGTWITYDDAESVRLKADYVRAQRLGGIMAWELGGDDGTLVRTLHERLR